MPNAPSLYAKISGVTMCLGAGLQNSLTTDNLDATGNIGADVQFNDEEYGHIPHYPLRLLHVEPGGPGAGAVWG